MTNAELIEILKQLPGGYRVMTAMEYGRGWLDADDIVISESEKAIVFTSSGYWHGDTDWQSIKDWSAS